MIAATLQFHITSEAVYPVSERDVLTVFADGEFALCHRRKEQWRTLEGIALPDDDQPIAWAQLPAAKPLLAAAKSAKSAKSADRKAAPFSKPKPRKIHD